MIPVEVQDAFDTVYPFAAYVIPALYVVILLVLVMYGARFFLKDSFKQIFIVAPLALIAAFGVAGVALTGAMEAQASAESTISGKVLDTADTGTMSVVDDTVVPTKVLLLETADGGLLGPLEITTAGVENAVGKTVTLSCDDPAAQESQILTCAVTHIAQ